MSLTSTAITADEVSTVGGALLLVPEPLAPLSHRPSIQSEIANPPLPRAADVFLAAYLGAFSRVLQICRGRGLGEDADEVYQQVAVAGLKAISEETQVENWQAFITRVAVCRCLDYQREKISDQARTRPLDDKIDLADAGAYPPDEEVMASEMRAVIERLVKRLPPDQQCILGLRMEGMTNEEIARELGISNGAVA